MEESDAPNNPQCGTISAILSLVLGQPVIQKTVNGQKGHDALQHHMSGLLVSDQRDAHFLPNIPAQGLMATDNPYPRTNVTCLVFESGPFICVPRLSFSNLSDCVGAIDNANC